MPIWCVVDRNTRKVSRNKSRRLLGQLTFSIVTYICISSTRLRARWSRVKLRARRTHPCPLRCDCSSKLCRVLKSASFRMRPAILRTRRVSRDYREQRRLPCTRALRFAPFSSCSHVWSACIAISKGIRRIWNYFKTYLRTSRYWKIIGICDERLSSWTCQSDGRLSCLTLYHVIWYIRILCIYLYTFYILYSFYFLSLRLDCYIDFLIYRFIADEQFYNNC